jgi:ceramide synthetase
MIAIQFFSKTLFESFQIVFAMWSVRHMTTISLDDLPVFSGVVLTYGIYRCVLCYGVLVKIANVLHLKAGMKFVHRTFDCIHYTISMFIGLAAHVGRPYSQCVYWAGRCAADLLPTPGAFICTYLEKVYYMVFTAYYVVDLAFIKTVPHDWKALGCHHLTTVAMILFAVLLRVPVIGLVVMLLHDVTDVPLYVGKVAGYLRWNLLKDVTLLSFVGLCTWFRMVNYLLLVGLMWWNLPLITHLKGLYVFTATLLLVLYGLHIYWHIKIMKAFFGALHFGEAEIRDTRSN